MGRVGIKSESLPGDAIPPGFEAFKARGVQDGYLTSSKGHGGYHNTMTTVHHFAPSHSIPQMSISSLDCFQFYPRADLMVTAAHAYLSGVGVEGLHISTSESGWSSCFKWRYSLGDEYYNYTIQNICLTSFRLAATVNNYRVASGWSLKIFVWDLTGKPYLVSLLIYSCSKRTKVMELLKENAPIATCSPCFIDEYRLLGVVPSRGGGNKLELALWDTSQKDPSPVRFECAGLNLEVSLCRSLESNHGLPFHGDLSEGIVGISRGGNRFDVLVIRVRDLIALSRGDKDKTVPWSQWGKKTTILEDLTPHFSVLHSQVVNVR